MIVVLQKGNQMDEFYIHVSSCCCFLLDETKKIFFFLIRDRKNYILILSKSSIKCIAPATYVSITTASDGVSLQVPINVLQQHHSFTYESREFLIMETSLYIDGMLHTEYFCCGGLFVQHLQYVHSMLG